MNYVNLIGKMASAPKYSETENMGVVASFTVSTKEPYLDEKGNPRSKKYWHKLVAWGNSISTIKEFAELGCNVAIEGRLVTRFYNDTSGKRRSVSEVQVNDFSVMI